MKKNAYPYTTGKDLMQKEVINKYDGGKLGYAKNFGLDLRFKNSFSLAKETLPLCIYLFLSAAIATIPW